MIAVIGAGTCNKKIYQLAEEVGKKLALKGYTIICGGLGGVMEAVCKGAKMQGGVTVGILPGGDPGEANPYIDIAIASGMGIGRNIIIVRSAEVVLAIDGVYGTLSELAFALQLNKQVVGLETWDISDKIIKANNASDAVDKIENLIASK